MNNQPPPGASNALTFGIIAVVTSFICCGPFAAIFSFIGLSNAKKAENAYNANPEMYPAGIENVKTGRILSYIGLAIAVIMLVLWILYFGFIIAMVTSNLGAENF